MAIRGWGIGRGTVVAGVLNVLAYVTAAVAGEYELGWLFWVMVAVGVVATMLLIVLSARSTVQGKRLVEAASASQRQVLQEMLVPLMELLGTIATTPTAAARREYLGQMKHAVITAARQVGPTNARVCFLEVNGPSGARTLRCPPAMWFGRQETPRTTFVEGTPRGDRLLTSMDSRKPLFVQDLAAESQQLQPDSNTYKTFIAAAVAPVSGHAGFGVLTIDAPKAGDLKDGDIKMIEVLGQLLGSALAL